MALRSRGIQRVDLALERTNPAPSDRWTIRTDSATLAHPARTSPPGSAAMASNNYKGIGVVYARTLYRDLDEAGQARVREALGTADTKVLETVGATTWVPISVASRIFEAVSPRSFPNSADPIRDLGRGMARHNLGFVYRAIVAGLGPSRLMAIYKRLWSLYHRDGRISLVDRTDTSCIIRVEGHPDIPSAFRECMAGWVAEGLLVAGAKGSWVVVDDSNLPTYSWRARWRNE